MEKNTREMNRRMMLSCVACCLALVSLIFFHAIDIFQFDPLLLQLITWVGIPLTLSPTMLYALKIPDKILQYYMAVSISIFIGMIGSFNTIGIYITFVLVPVASCMYLDPHYTGFCSVFSYLVMVISVYLNAAGKLETIYAGRSHWNVFIGYIIGFTLEYIIIAVCLYQIMKRANEVLDAQKQAFLKQQSQDARYQLLVKETNDVIFEYFPETGRYSANRSLFQAHGETNEMIAGSIRDLVQAYPKLQVMVDRLNAGVPSGNYDDFEFDMSYERDGKPVPLWYVCECFRVQLDGQPVSVIGKLHDITKNKKLQESSRQQRLNDLCGSAKRANSLYEQTLKASADFSEADFGQLAAGHQFLAGLLEKTKYEDDPVVSLQGMLAAVGYYFHLDRICVVETDMTSGTNAIHYQWNARKTDELTDYFTYLSSEEIAMTRAAYDRLGCIEYNPTHGILMTTDGNDRVKSEAVLRAHLGNQLWIPTLAEGEYTGAVYLDRYDTTPYTPVEKFLLSEAVNSIYTDIRKINAEKANKAKSDFLSTMSHEIRTPMNAIVGMTEVALREEMSPAVMKNLKMVKSSAFGLLTLINDILDFSKIEAGRFEIVPEKFSLLSVLNDVSEITAAKNAGKLEIRKQIPEDLPSCVYADAVRIRQVMINFCTNAIKYTDAGHVEMIVAVNRTDDTHADLVFRVKDTGIGIQKEDLPRLFRSYTQVDTTVNHHKEGTGLGLAISRQLVELMQGSVSVTSEYGHGSEFSFRVPVEVLDWSAAGRLEDYSYEEPDAARDDALVYAPRARVLIVDDNELNLMVAEALMEPAGMQIDTVQSGADALELLAQQDYDLIFMDHFMPDMDGVETTRRIRAGSSGRNQHTPIIALTADAMSGVKEELLGAGMDEFLTKPIIIAELNQALRKWLPGDKQNQN